MLHFVYAYLGATVGNCNALCESILAMLGMLHCLRFGMWVAFLC